MDKENKIETAKEYCKRIDLEEGEVWSNDYEELPLKMQEYAQYYHQAKLPETLAELEKVKTTRDQYFKAAIHAQDKLTQAEKELGKLRERNNTALKLKENALTLYERMSNELIQKSNNFYGVEEENKKLRKFVQKIVDSKSLTLEQLGLVLLDFQTKAQQLLTPKE